MTIALFGDVEKQTAKLAKKRAKLVASIEEIDKRIVPLYERISTRYRGTSVSVAIEGSCRSCFRALPYQLYNQVLAGNSMLQCPGCSRLIVCPPNEVQVGVTA